MLPQIMLGIRRAAEAFVAEFSDMPTVIETLDVPVIENMSCPNYRLIVELVKFTKKQML